MVDSFEPLFALNAIAARHVGRRLTRAQYAGFFRGNVHEALSRWLPEPREFRRFSRFKESKFANYYSRARLFPFARMVPLLSVTHRLGIVSSTPKRAIEALLRRHGLRRHFEIVVGSRARSKAAGLRKARRRLSSVPAGPAYLITDTVGDIVAAKATGLRALAVCWGFLPERALRAAGAVRLFRKPRPLLRYLART